MDAWRLGISKRGGIGGLIGVTACRQFLRNVPDYNAPLYDGYVVCTLCLPVVICTALHCEYSRENDISNQHATAGMEDKQKQPSNNSPAQLSYRSLSDSRLGARRGVRGDNEMTCSGRHSNTQYHARIQKT
ncbi:hypothetical protein BaRGS_00027333 [Batillaria attramentaria]|uniref:Uncharacterized protein n=1 Tax=Batillaria attramentaria TaxID=370345 RepID=A0ABD0K2Q4_9CAEN